MKRSYESTAAKSTWTNLFAAILLAALLFSQAVRSSAQTPLTPAVETALHQTVHLNQAGATLRSVLAALTKQTGVVFEAQSCLPDRVMTLSADGQTGLNVLLALAELYDWRWVQTNDGRIYISRQPLPEATTLPEIQDAVRRSLPVDFKRYLGIGVSIDTLPPPPDLDGHQRPDSELNFLKRRPKLLWKQYSGVRRSMALDWLDECLRRELADQPAKTPFRNWNRSLRQLVIAKLMLSALAAPLASGSFYCHPLVPFQSDISRTEVRICNGALSVGLLYPVPNSVAGIIFEWFGIMIPEEVARWQKEQLANGSQLPGQ